MKTIDEAIFDVLADDLPHSSSEIKERVCSDIGANKNSVTSAIQRLTDSGKLIRLSGGYESKFLLGNFGLGFGVSRNMLLFNEAISQARSA